MEGANFILESRNTPHLYVRLTRFKARAQWEFTEDFELATTFLDEDEIDRRMQLHRVPRTVKVRPYENAYSDWLHK